MLNTEKNQKEKIKKINFRKDIQVLRGIAVFSVVLFHFSPGTFINGYLGVDIFFVISGFLISNIIFSELSDKKFKLKLFFLRRVRRIIPAFLIALIFANLLAFLVQDYENLMTTGRNSLLALFFISNVGFANMSNYFDGDIEVNLIINFWSLSIEEQFYIIFPFLALLIYKIKFKNKIFILTIILLISLFSSTRIFFEFIPILNKIFFSFESYSFYSPTVRVWEFIIGILAMLLNTRYNIRGKNFVSNLIFLLLVFFLFSNFKFVNFHSIYIVCLLTAIILVIKFSENKKLNYQNIYLLEKLGLISYSVYLFHQPIFAAIKTHNINTTLHGKFHLDLDNYIVLFLIFTFIVLISSINYHFVENKFRKEYIFKNNYKKFFSVSLSLIFFMLIMNFLSDGFMFRHNEKNTFNQSSQEYEVKKGTNYIINNNDKCINKDFIESTCKFQKNNQNKKIYLLGDSKISSLTSGFLQTKYLDDFTFIEYTRQGCELRFKLCDFYPGSLKFSELSTIENSILILGGGYEQNAIHSEVIFKNDIFYIQSENLIKERFDEYYQILDETINTLSGKGNRIILLRPIPTPGVNLRMYYFVNRKYVDLDYSSFKAFNDKTQPILDKLNYQDLFIINLDSVFCNSNICRFYSNDEYFFVDDAHLGHFGAIKVADFIMSEIYKFEN